jgi:hypothetical protein
MPLSKTKMFPVVSTARNHGPTSVAKAVLVPSGATFPISLLWGRATVQGPLISILFRGHFLRRFENPGFALVIKAKHNRASSDHYIVGARFLGFDLSH